MEEGVVPSWEKRVFPSMVYVCKHSSQWWTQLVNIQECNFSIKGIEAICSISKQNSFSHCIVKYVTHWMYGSFTTSFMDGTELVSASGLQYVRLHNKKDCLANNSSHYLTNTNGSHSLTLFRAIWWLAMSAAVPWGSTHSFRATKIRLIAQIDGGTRCTQAYPTKSIKTRDISRFVCVECCSDWGPI